jgi:hypothetical protein
VSTAAGPAELQPEPLLRWNNQIVQEDDAAFFLWTTDGRPVAAAQLFMQGDDWHHEFQSLHDDGFSAYAPGQAEPFWQPAGSGIQYAAVADADPPGATPGVRLRQMRDILRSFRAKCSPDTEENPEELRLLSTPLYRYQCASNGIEDGALFAFAQGTNPEVLLLVETHREGNASVTWRYAIAPMMSWAAEVAEDGEVVWEQPKAEVPTPTRDGPYYFRYRVDLGEFDVGD